MSSAATKSVRIIGKGRKYILSTILTLFFIIFFLPSAFWFAKPEEQAQLGDDVAYFHKLLTPFGLTRVPSSAFQVEDGTNLTAVYERLIEEYLAPWAPVLGFAHPPVTTRMLDAMEFSLRKAHFRVRIVDGVVYYRKVAEIKPDHRVLRINCMLEMMQQTVNEYNISNTEFYVGIGDGPHFRLDTLINTLSGVPVFSKRTGYAYIDVPVPDPAEQGCYGNYVVNDTDLPPWDNRIPKAFFRGVTSQFYLQVDNWHTAQRIKLAQWSEGHPDLLDAGLTDFIRMGDNTPFGPPTTDEIAKSIGITLVPPVPIETQTQYKYVIDVDGGLGSSRKSSILKGKSTLIRQDSMFYQHYDPLLRPMQHFIPLDFNLRDVTQIVSFLQRNDALAKRVADAGHDFAQRHLNAESYRLYWAILLRRYTALLDSPPRNTSDVGVDACKVYPNEKESYMGGDMGCSLGWKRWEGIQNSYVQLKE
ncbi:glycosyl transferase family 90-domain-containing protein [Endogone sp. FLAS-F59071]|nr:glycosyl transferase family 90-domain-containing protein [Endogone sp. FLAS-F59071]|eukprot:RUS19890.1 glycosyl transferase family 90-domain-containing protein [Endogone sp. FLAS-F59071]